MDDKNVMENILLLEKGGFLHQIGMMLQDAVFIFISKYFPDGIGRLVKNGGIGNDVNDA